MKPIFVTIAALTAFAATPLLAADAQPWPWKSKTPRDPALGMLSHVDHVKVSIDDGIVNITVDAKAPTPDYSELQLTHRLGDQEDRIFAFDARGRRPQGDVAQMETPVTVTASYADAPIANFDVIEVLSKDNCVGYSVKDAKTVECVTKPQPE